MNINSTIFSNSNSIRVSQFVTALSTGINNSNQLLISVSLYVTEHSGDIQSIKY